jgi:hypothetical protein
MAHRFSELCLALGKSATFVRHVQRSLDLPAPPQPAGYSDAYLSFLEKIVWLRAFGISLERIAELFEAEKKILHFLHVDSLSDSPTWYLDACRPANETPMSETRLLLTDSDIGLTPDSRAVQHSLDFGKRDKELFGGSEMGEDLKLMAKRYWALLDGIVETINQEQMVLENALAWSRRLPKRRSA